MLIVRAVQACDGCPSRWAEGWPGRLALWAQRFSRRYMAGREWRRSSHSGGDNGSQCVEVALLRRRSDRAQIRDSKNPGPRLCVTPAALASLVELVRR